MEAAYLNPALVAHVIHGAVSAYVTEGGRDMDWMLSHIAVPLVFHRPARESVPANPRTHLSTWLTRNPEIVVGMPERMAAMAPYTLEGFRMALSGRLIALREGSIRPNAEYHHVPEIRQFGRAAERVGRLLAKSAATSSVYIMFGVRA